MRVETVTRFLTAVVEDEDCAYSTQKQAFNALALFFKYVYGVEEPVFNVKLRKTGTRLPVVISKDETQRVFEKLEVSAMMIFDFGLWPKRCRQDARWPRQPRRLSYFAKIVVRTSIETGEESIGDRGWIDD